MMLMWFYSDVNTMWSGSRFGATPCVLLSSPCWQLMVTHFEWTKTLILITSIGGALGGLQLRQEHRVSCSVWIDRFLGGVWLNLCQSLQSNQKRQRSRFVLCGCYVILRQRRLQTDVSSDQLQPFFSATEEEFIVLKKEVAATDIID